MKPRSRLESSIEKSVVDWAKREWPRLRIRKMNGLGNRGWPDRAFFGPAGVFFIEFKRLGKLPTPLQAETIEGLRGDGYPVEVFDQVEPAKAWITKMMRRKPR